MSQSATTVIRHHQIDEAYSVVFHAYDGVLYASINSRIGKIRHRILSAESARFPGFGPLCGSDSYEIDELIRSYKAECFGDIQITGVANMLMDLSISKPEDSEASKVREVKTATHDQLRASNQDSDSDLELPEHESSLFVYSKLRSVRASAISISCAAEEGMPLNVKGSVLIEAVHKAIQEWYNEAVSLAYEYGDPLLPSPYIKEDNIYILAPRDWVMSLGGWKGMMPREEIKEYFLSKDIKGGDKFKGACIYNNGEIFKIKDNRIHIPQGFKVCGFDVTGYWKMEGNEWVKEFSGKTDLSYNQIVEAIKKIKNKSGLDDSQLASIQLHRVSNYCKSKTEISQDVSDNDKKKILIFLDYLNALMFGIEASGLNAGIAIGLMTLDLIRDGRFTYETCFKANKEGGVYPYACFGNNKGTYTEREKILLHKKNSRNPLSMKAFRDQPSLSPVALKEAALIKIWLEENDAVSRELVYREQLASIGRAMDDLIAYYLSPWLCGKTWRLEKFVMLSSEV